MGKLTLLWGGINTSGFVVKIEFALSSIIDFQYIISIFSILTCIIRACVRL